ncbi:MAG: radical SAM protein [Planctomycetota bacterium]|nr:radical SAM protein [Planctomycetota bacterium]
MQDEIMTLLPANIGSFSEPIQRLWDYMNPCTLCPRRCKIHRSEGQIGFCGIGCLPTVSSVGPHFGEESVLVARPSWPCLHGLEARATGGSGTIFFAGCNLGCIFCQNYDISHHRHGHQMTIEQLAQSMLELQNYGCININFVTPTHVIAAIAAAIELARKDGLTIPTVYNTGGYDSVETLKLLEGFVDIYMPDMKYSDSKVAQQLSNAPDYPQVNREAVREMHRQVGDLQIEKGFTAESAETAEKKQKIISACPAVSAVKVKGLAKRGLLIRHLVLPENLAGSFEIIDFLAKEISPNTAINVMDQYRPCYKAHLYPQINRRPYPEEIESVRQYAIEKGLSVIS